MIGQFILGGAIAYIVGTIMGKEKYAKGGEVFEPTTYMFGKEVDLVKTYNENDDRNWSAKAQNLINIYKKQGAVAGVVHKGHLHSLYVEKGKWAKGGKVGGMTKDTKFMYLYDFADQKMIEGDEEAEVIINEQGYDVPYDTLYNFADQKMIEGDEGAERVLKMIGGYAKGGRIKKAKRGQWLQGKQWHIYYDNGWRLERYKGDEMIELFSINIEPSGDFGEDDEETMYIEYFPTYSGDIKIPENVQVKIISILQEDNPELWFGDEYDDQIRRNEYSELYARGGRLKTKKHRID